MSKLTRYIVFGEVTISVHTEVLAKNIQDAERIALGRELTSLPAFEEYPEEFWCTSGELDGEVKFVGVEEDR